MGLCRLPRPALLPASLAAASFNPARTQPLCTWEDPHPPRPFFTLSLCAWEPYLSTGVSGTGGICGGGVQKSWVNKRLLVPNQMHRSPAPDGSGVGKMVVSGRWGRGRLLSISRAAKKEGLGSELKDWNRPDLVRGSTNASWQEKPLYAAHNPWAGAQPSLLAGAITRAPCIDQKGS